MENVYDLLKELKDLGARIYVLDGKIKLDIRSGYLTNELSEKIRHHRDEILAIINETSKSSEFVQIKKVADQACYPISDAQRRLWVMSQFKGGSAAYNVPGKAYLDQDIHIDCFQKAIESTIVRHEILRTVFRENKVGEIMQWVLNPEDLGFKIDRMDFRREKNKEEKVKLYIEEDSYKAFDLEKGPLLRAALLQLENGSYVFYYNMHHIISDGWSMEVLKKDIFAYYEAYKNNTNAVLKDLKIQYKDYSAWQLAQLEDVTFKGHKAYWLERFSSELPLLDLPGTKQRPSVRTNNGIELSTSIDMVTTTKLKKYAQDKGGSLFMGLLAVWNVLLYRYTSQTDIITGTPVTGREHADLEDQIGFYVNTLALRNEITPEDSFDELFFKVKQNTLNAYSHQMYPFDRLVEDLNVQRDAGRNAVFDILLTLQNNEGRSVNVDLMANELKQESLSSIRDLGYSPINFDIRLNFQETEANLLFNFTYNPDIYERGMAEGMIYHYRQLLQAILENPGEKIALINYLSPEEKHELLDTFIDTPVTFPKDKTILDLFEEQVEKTPHNTAVVFNEKELSYQHLNETANQLANYLRSVYQVGPNELIGIELTRSEWMIIAMLAVLKAGGAYVPIDPEYPQDRKKHLKEDCNYKVCLNERELNKFIEDQDKYSRQNIASSAKSSDLAYVIYTSGSTGNPKGVMIERHGLVNMALDHVQKLGLSSSDKILQFVSFSFDGSVIDIFMALVSGATLVVLSQDLIIDHVGFVKYIDEQQITVMTLPPAFLRALNQPAFKSVRTIITAGEPANVLDAQYYSGIKNFYNAYGPTESTVNTTLYKVDPSRNYNTIPIGRAAYNKHIYILSDFLQLQPKGVIGEICIGGTGLSRGYLNQEAVTKEKFVAHPFKEGERLYRTGDLGKWLPDGNIEFVGRKDHQVKIRGYRIELGEIEHALQSYKTIEEAVVVAKTNENNEKELVAYITSKEDQNTMELRSYLKERLPEYMLPAYYVQLGALPLNLNGKIERRSLPDPKNLGLGSGVEYIAQRNEIEKKLVKIWEDVLKRENIGVKDDFFALGGHSLKIIKVINHVSKQFGLKYDFMEIYTEPTIEAMAHKIKTDLWFSGSKIANENDYNEIKL